MSARTPHYPVPSEHQTRAMVEGVLHGRDRVVMLHPVERIHELGRKVPKRLLPQPTVFPPMPKAEPRRPSWWEYPLVAYMAVTDYLARPFEWIGHQIGEGILWLFRTPKQRRKLKRLKGGWDSVAGGLLSKTRPTDHQMLVVGDRLLSLVYVGPEAAELAWSAPREQLIGAEYTLRDKHFGNRKSTVRLHFADSSWGDIRGRDPGPDWQKFLEHLPQH